MILSLNEQDFMFRALDQWFVSPQGLHIVKAFTHQLADVNPFLYGETLLQLGDCGGHVILPHHRFHTQWILSPVTKPSVTLVSSLNKLPFGRDSIDCIISPLTMDVFMKERQVLDELDRVLKPMGYLIFFGVSPLSLWGCWLKRKRNACFMQRGYPRSVFFLKHTLSHRGYEQCHLTSFYYLPPLKDERWMERFNIFNEFGKIIPLIPAGFYCLVMQKYQEMNLLVGSTLRANESLHGIMDRPLQPSCLTKQ